MIIDASSGGVAIGTGYATDVSNGYYTGTDGNITDVSFDISDNSLIVEGKVGIGTNSPNVILDISGSDSDALRLPHGNTDARPITTDEETHGGYIRYNDGTHQFEGYGPGSSWGSLGGVVNVAQNTKIVAESGPAETNNQLQFYTAPKVGSLNNKADHFLSRINNRTEPITYGTYSQLPITGGSGSGATLEFSGDATGITYIKIQNTMQSPPLPDFPGYIKGDILTVTADEFTASGRTTDLVFTLTTDGPNNTLGGDDIYLDPDIDTDGTMAERMIVDSNGYVGIGTTTPQSKLDVEGSVRIGSGYSGNNTITTNPTNGMIIEGNVGIGTSNPQSKLDVDGTMNVTGDTTLTTVAASGTMDVSGATVLDGTLTVNTGGAVDINSGAFTIDGSTVGINGTSTINIGEGANTGAINVGTGASARTITVGNATGTTKLDMNAGTSGIEMDTTGAVSIDSAAASNFTTSAGVLSLNGAGGVSIAGNAAEVDITTFGAVDINSGAFTVDGTTVAINGTNTSTGITIGTKTSGVPVTIGHTTSEVTVADNLTVTGATVLGGTLAVTGKVTIGGAAVSTTTTVNLEVNGQVKASQFNAISDARFKTNIQHVTDSLSIINQLNGMSFTWIGDDTNKQVFGLIAQEVEKVLPEIVNTSTTENEQGFNPKSIHYDGLFPHLIESVKTLSKENETLKTKVNTLETKMEMIMKHLNL